MRYLYFGAAFAFVALSALPLTARTISVSPSACQALTAHTPSDDVAYKPGVDVAGGAVAPADLNASGQLDLGAEHEFWLPIELPLDNALSIATTDTLNVVRDSKIGVGSVTVKDGRAYFNGEPLGDAQSHAIAAECEKQRAAALR